MLFKFKFLKHIPSHWVLHSGMLRRVHFPPSRAYCWFAPNVCFHKNIASSSSLKRLPIHAVVYIKQKDCLCVHCGALFRRREWNTKTRESCGFSPKPALSSHLKHELLVGSEASCLTFSHRVTLTMGKFTSRLRRWRIYEPNENGLRHQRDFQSCENTACANSRLGRGSREASWECLPASGCVDGESFV